MQECTVGVLVAGPTGETARGSVPLAGITVAVTLTAYLFLCGVGRRSAVLIGMAAATASRCSAGSAPSARPGSGFSLPALLSRGTPRFDVLAAPLLLVLSLSMLAGSTGRTVLNSAASGRAAPHHARAAPISSSRTRATWGLTAEPGRCTRYAVLIGGSSGAYSSTRAPEASSSSQR